MKTGRPASILSLLAILLFPGTALAQTDPGVRTGAINGQAGATPTNPLPLASVAANSPTGSLEFFQNGLARFEEVEVVSGGSNNGLGPRFNFNQCSGCHSQPTIGGTSPPANPEFTVIANGIASVTVEMEGARPCTPDEIKDPNRKQPCFFEQNLSFESPHIVVLDNNLYHQYAVLPRLYDWSKRGPQTFSVLIPQELMPGTITAEAIGSAKLDGKSYEGFRVNTTDLEVDLYLDSAHRLMRLEVPAAKVSVIRD